MTRLFCLLVATFTLSAHASFTATTVFQTPDSGSRGNYGRNNTPAPYFLIDGGTAVLEAGFSDPSRLYRFTDPNNFYLLTGFSNGNVNFYEPAPHQIFFMGEQENDSTTIHRYIKGYDLNGGQVKEIVSALTFNGSNYSAPPALTSLSLDGKQLYFTTHQRAGDVLTALDFASLALNPLFSLPSHDGENVTSVQEITLVGKTSIAVTTQDRDELGSIYLYDPLTGNQTMSVKAATLGLAVGGVRADLRAVRMSPDGTRALLCDPDTCVLYNMISLQPVDQFKTDGTSAGNAVFTPDSRYVLLSQSSGLASGTTMSVHRADDGSVALPATPAGQHLVNRVLALPEAQAYLVLHGEVLFVLSMRDGSLLQRYALSDATNYFTDIHLLDTSARLIHFETVDSHGLVQKWDLGL